MKEDSVAPQLSRIRTFLFGALALTWFSEMVFLGFQPFSKVWTHLWQVVPPKNPQLAAAVSITWAIAAPAKGALCVLAVFGLRSRNPAARAALFASMALVPPLNLAFPFRQQGFLFGPVAVATVLSTILWGSFFLFREPSQKPEQSGTGGSGLLPPSRWENLQYIWFAVNSAVLTLIAFLFLFWPRTGLNFVFPWLSTLFNTFPGELPSLIHTEMASGTHLLALATASWAATINCRRNPALRQALTAASTVHAGLFFVFPFRQVILEFGGNRVASSLMIAFAPLLVGWMLYAAFSYHVEAKK